MENYRSRTLRVFNMLRNNVSHFRPLDQRLKLGFQDFMQESMVFLIISRGLIADPLCP